MKITALVVTYNRLEYLKKNLAALFDQSRKPDEIIVIDNASTDGTYEFLKDQKVKFVRLSENTGGAGGFSYGLNYAIENGADWVWMMDDDAIPYNDALKALEDAINKRPDAGVFLSQLVSDSNSKPKEKIKSAWFGTFVGFAVRKEVVKSVGLPDSEFFIYADDYDYSIRIRKAGFKILRVHSSLIDHKDWIKQKRVFRFPFSKPQVPAWKTYYLFRNPILATRNFKIINLAVTLYLSIDRYIWSYVDPSARSYIFKGFEDGRKGIKGKRIDPRKPLLS
ncbi:glycosyltransferase family 2 protein [Athalassotoga saccharophila]|uniref:glycosyltransferase family 2 protein n=1 Tax=Athalassotoga saccharophila TaxID=1441386 RepID=UPI00137A3C8A|nr:glycosyltransferase family 2 protein [Athalassotoga saccharophila]